ncbi:putative Ent-kaurene oxidase [Glarea lozoyensis 74030]|uniref:Putative Ent-kaurene oxidase n=1 Tax=Glarea lozoyensis (strain ATCC 74030 / MF5533) TaxID=1104152 RepID=H0ELC4_GLAL7|nr:putative Ent-kaurene oxidase [Glarea lozoyensis 74030]
MECEFPKCQDWTPLAVHPKMLRIMSLVVSLMIVGPTLSRNEEWLMTMAKFVEGIFIAGWELKKYSQFVRPLISRGLVPGVRGILQLIKNMWTRFVRSIGLQGLSIRV